MTIEVTQGDEDRAREICDNLGLIVGTVDWLNIARSCARHRQAAYAKGEVAGIMLRDDYYNKVRERDAKGGGL